VPFRLQGDALRCGAEEERARIQKHLVSCTRCEREVHTQRLSLQSTQEVDLPMTLRAVRVDKRGMRLQGVLAEGGEYTRARSVASAGVFASASVRAQQRYAIVVGY